MLGKIEGKRRRARQRVRWLDGITDLMDMGLGGLSWSVSICVTPKLVLSILTAPHLYRTVMCRFQICERGEGCVKAAHTTLFLLFLFWNGEDTNHRSVSFLLFFLELSHCLFTNQYLFMTYYVRHFEKTELK